MLLQSELSMCTGPSRTLTQISVIYKLLQIVLMCGEGSLKTLQRYFSFYIPALRFQPSRQTSKHNWRSDPSIILHICAMIYLYESTVYEILFKACICSTVGGGLLLIFLNAISHESRAVVSWKVRIASLAGALILIILFRKTLWNHQSCSIVEASSYSFRIISDL